MTSQTPAPTRRRFSPGAAILTAILIVSAALTLIGFAPLPYVPADANNTLATVGAILTQMVAVTAAFAVILGVLNLLSVHTRRIGRGGVNAFYSVITILAAIVVVALHLADRAGLLTSVEPADTARSFVSLTVLDSVQVAMESALGGLIAFFLVYAVYRMLRRRLSGWNLLFAVALIVALLGYAPITALGGFGAVRDWLMNVLVQSGARGILIGVALGTVVVGVRLLLGQDRTLRE